MISTRAARLLVCSLLLAPAAGAAGFVAGPHEPIALDDAHSASFAGHRAFAADGTSVLVWTRWQDDGTEGDIVAQRYDPAGLPLGERFRVNQRQDRQQQNAALAMAPSGRFAIAWTSYEETGTRVFLRRFAADGRPLGDEVDVDPTATTASLPTLVLDGHGRVAVAWYDVNGVALQRFNWRGEPVGRRLQLPGASNPALTARPDGGYWLAWRAFSIADGVQLFARRFRGSSAPDGASIRLDTEPIPGQGMPAIASDSAGALAATWATCDFQHFERGCKVFLRRVSSNGTPFGPARLLSAQDARAHDYPTLAFQPDGTLGVAWRICEGSDCHQRLRFFTADGAGLAPAALIFSPGMPWNAALSASNGAFHLDFDITGCGAEACGAESEGLYGVELTRQ